MRRLLATLAIVATLTGCALNPAGVSVFQGGTSLTAPIQNPARAELASLELAYQAAAQAFVLCRDTRCTSSANLEKARKFDREKAYPALVVARRAVRDNPTVSGLSAVGIAKKAIADYNAAVHGAVR